MNNCTEECTSVTCQLPKTQKAE